MRRAGIACCLAALLAGPAGAAAPPPSERWVVVVAPAFRAAVAPLVAHRQAQGMRVTVLDSSTVLSAQDVRNGDGGKLRKRLRELWRDHAGTSYVLLVGAGEAGSLAQPERFVVPALSGAAGRMKGEPTDAGYGCRDGERLPAVAVGRLPARTEAEARAMVAKTLALEKAAGPGGWKRRLTVLAGIPAYNPVVDRLVESIAFARFERINPLWRGKVVYTNPLSRFCLPDDQLRTRALAYLAEGQAFTLYLGHSSAEGLYGGQAAFLNRADWGRLAGSGVFVTFGCNGCQLRGKRAFLAGGPPDEEGYGVAAVRNPRGPAAVLGSHGICFAAMVQLAADGLFRRAFSGPLPRRLGECWLGMLEGLERGKIDFLTYHMLDAVDGDSSIPQTTQRAEHLEMFVLLGDPALRLPEMPGGIRLRHPLRMRPGKTLLVRGSLPVDLHGARVRATLERSPSSVPEGLVPVPKEPGAARDRALLANHARANDFIVAQSEATAEGDGFAVRLEVPARLPWPRLALRVHARTKHGEAMTTELIALPQP
jgi:hypothetical protein